MNSSIDAANKSVNNINKITYVSKTFYSPKNYLEPTKSVSGHISSSINNNVINNTTTNGTIWNSSKVLLTKDVPKDKAYLFKSQKYIRDFKGTSMMGGNDSSILVKKEEQKWGTWLWNWMPNFESEDQIFSIYSKNLGL